MLGSGWGAHALVSDCTCAVLHWKLQIRFLCEMADLVPIIIIQHAKAHTHGGETWQVKVIDTDKFDVQVIAPRPYFIFTPMLAASSVVSLGTSHKAGAQYTEKPLSRHSLSVNPKNKHLVQDFDIVWNCTGHGRIPLDLRGYEGIQSLCRLCAGERDGH